MRLCTLVLAGSLGGCAALPAPESHVPETGFAAPQTTWLGRLATDQAPATPGLSGVRVLDRGREALDLRLALVDAAERSLDLQTYIWHLDASGRLFACRVLAAAERGVRVRLLVDDLNPSGWAEPFLLLDAHPLIDLRLHNPLPARGAVGRWLFILAELPRLSRRMHNKALVVDGAAGIVGGRNIGDEYFDLHPSMNFRDRDVLAVGPVVADMATSFDLFWNSELAYPVARLAPAAARAAGRQAAMAARDGDGLWALLCGEAQAGSAADPASARASLTGILASLSWAQATMVFDPVEQLAPGGRRVVHTGARSLLELMEGAEREVTIESAYLSLDGEQLELLETLRARGVRVAALTNSLGSNDVVAAHAGYARRRQALLERGVALYELDRSPADCPAWIASAAACRHGRVSLHAKTAVFDRETVYVGSFNLSTRSIYLNTETGLVMHSRQVAEEELARIEQAMAPGNAWRVRRDAAGRLSWEAGENQRRRAEPAAGFWRRLGSRLLRLLPLENFT